MKDLKISIKMILVFALIGMFMLGSLFFSSSSMSHMNTNDDILYKRNTLSIDLISRIGINFQQQRVQLRDILLRWEEPDKLAELLSKSESLDNELKGYLEAYVPTISFEEEGLLINEFGEFYTTTFSQVKKTVFDCVEASDVQGAMQAMLEGLTSAEYYTGLLEETIDLNSQEARNRVDENTLIFLRNVNLLVIFIIVAIVLLVLMGIYVNRTIVRPIGDVTAVADQVAKGNLKVDTSGLRTNQTDEVGTLSKAVVDMLADLAEQSDTLTTVAKGDLSVPCLVRGEGDVLGSAVSTMCDSLNQDVTQITAVAEQVGQGAEQVSQGSRSLAQGATEQAAAVEELSSTIVEISINTKESAKKAEKSAQLFANMRGNILRGNQQMEGLRESIEQINASATNVSKVLKLINNIAFQTNILSLNAAVEAANAGEYGKGFSAVAEEVRALAVQASEASKSSAELIEDAMEKAELGLSIAETTSKDLSSVINEIVQNVRLVEDISRAAQEQAAGIEQVNVGIEQVARVITLNSESAEQSAIAAEQMLAQANAMKQLMRRFKTRASATDAQAPIVRQDAVVKPMRREGKKPVIILDNDFGKY